MTETRKPTPLALVGCDFRVASSRVRSRLVLSPDTALSLAQKLKREKIASGFVDLSTCNRNEWLASCTDPAWAGEVLRAQMKQRVSRCEEQALEPYVLLGDAAARHILRVVIGQESLVIGERQIAGQFFRALEAARQRGTASTALNALGSVAGRLLRIAIRRGLVGCATRGVHGLAVDYLRKEAGTVETMKVAVIGLGSIGRRVLGLLEAGDCFSAVLCNRTVDDASRVRPLTAIPKILDQVDAAVVCTGAPGPILESSSFVSSGRTRPLLLLDLGVPEQISRVGWPEVVQIVGLDDLAGSAGTHEEAEKQEVDELVTRAFDEFAIACSERVFSRILDTVQRHHRQVVREEIPRLLRGRLQYLPADLQQKLEADLRSIVLDYTSEVFRTVRESSRQIAGREL